MAQLIYNGLNQPYLKRWRLLPRNRWLNIYIHKFIASDDPRAQHDHPYANMSVILKGRYLEHRGPHRHMRRAFVPILRKASQPHRVELIDGPVWTLFITGPRVREWGFHCKSGWKHWRDFVDPDDINKVGPGCGEE